ncbi:MAG: phosphate acyltransferase PlsX [Baekduia sp.]
MRAPTVAVDSAGADAGPAAVAAAAADACARDDLRVLLFGPAAELERGLAGAGEGAGGVTVVDAPLSIAKLADPAAAVRGNPESSIAMVARAVRDGDAQAFVSGGGTGAALAAGTLIVRRARGISRPALALPLPRPAAGGIVTLLDVGANTEVRADQLVQFAFMGSALHRLLTGADEPRVGLLSNGAEAERGRTEVVEANARLAVAGGGLRFAGNVEGNELLAGRFDVVVCDGFTGNVVLKTAEGVSQAVLEAVRAAVTATPRGKAGGLLIKPAVSDLRAGLDPEQYGGAYLLGLRALGVVPHGRFGRHGFAQAIRLAARGAREDLVGRLQAGLEGAGALRGAG